MNKDEKIEEVLTKGVVQVLPKKQALAKLMRKRKIRIYLGIDPTDSNIHIGHAVVLVLRIDYLVPRVR